MQSLQTGNNRQPLTQGPRGTVNLLPFWSSSLPSAASASASASASSLSSSSSSSPSSPSSPSSSSSSSNHLKNLNDHTGHYIHNHISDILSYPKVRQPIPEKTSTPGIAKVTLIHQSCTAHTVLMLIGSAKNWPGFGGRNIIQVQCFLLVPLVFVGSARNRSNVWYGCKPKAWDYKSPHKIVVFLLSLNQTNHII